MSTVSSPAPPVRRRPRPEPRELPRLRETGTAAALLAVAALGLRWWGSPWHDVPVTHVAEWHIRTLLGLGRAGRVPVLLLLGLAVLALVTGGLARSGRLPCWPHQVALAAAGATSVLAAVQMLTRCPVALGAWLTGLLGLVALAGSVLRSERTERSAQGPAEGPAPCSTRGPRSPQQQRLQPARGHDDPDRGHDQEVREMTEQAEVDRPGGEPAHQLDRVEQR
jgi:hypothetical protein